jgi:hypothetical protein
MAMAMAAGLGRREHCAAVRQLVVRILTSHLPLLWVEAAADQSSGSNVGMSALSNPSGAQLR